MILSNLLVKYRLIPVGLLRTKKVYTTVFIPINIGIVFQDKTKFIWYIKKTTSLATIILLNIKHTLKLNLLINDKFKSTKVSQYCFVYLNKIFV